MNARDRPTKVRKTRNHQRDRRQKGRTMRKRSNPLIDRETTKDRKRWNRHKKRRSMEERKC